MMETIRPDLSSRSLDCSVEHISPFPPAVIYDAFTHRFDHWFAAPGTLLLKAEVDSPFFFETHFDGQRHAHYGRYLSLVPGERLEMTWVTGNPGTLGAETVVSVDLAPHDQGSRVILNHAGFPDEEIRDRHAAAWVEVLIHLDRCMAEHTPDT